MVETSEFQIYICNCCKRFSKCYLYSCQFNSHLQELGPPKVNALEMLTDLENQALPVR